MHMTRFASGYVTGVALLICAVIAFSGGRTLAASATRRPSAAVRGVQQAIDTSDMILLTRYMDLDGLITRAVSVAVADASVREAVAQYPAAALVLAVGGNDAVDALRALLASEIREYVRHGVTSGAFAGAPRAGVSTYRGLFGSIFRGGARDRVTITSSSITRKSAEEALINAMATYGGKDETYPLTLRARKETDDWRITDIVNMAELVRQCVGK